MRRPKPSWIVLATLLAAALAAGAACRGAGSTGGSAVEVHKWVCAMHPQVVSDKPGNCPICGMRLVPLTAAPGAGATPRASQGAAVAGRAAVELTPDRRALLGVRSEELRSGRLEREIRTVGRVAVDERRLHHVHTKFDGYVEHLYVDFTGKYVEKGQPLLSIYSPDLVATQQEYLLAHRAQQEMSRSGSPDVAHGGEGLLQAARQRLLFWDIRPQDIERLEQTGEVMRTLDLHADISGFVVQKMPYHGMRVTPADTLFDIADLSQLWVLADVYESDLPLVKLGMAAELTVPYLPGKRWRGPVTYVAPTVDDKTRTIKVRVEVDNQGGHLKPDMFADVFLKSDLGTGLLLPENAVIHAGDRHLAFVETADGRYEPREVEIGVKVGDGFQVLSGLREGERVVTSANFLLDSESSLKAAISAMGASTPGSPAPGSPTPGGAAGPHRH